MISWQGKKLSDDASIAGFLTAKLFRFAWLKVTVGDVEVLVRAKTRQQTFDLAADFEQQLLKHEE